MLAETAARRAAAPVRWARALPWLALTIAFSPVLLELGHDLGRSPKHRYLLFVAALLAGAWARGGSRQPGRRDGALGLALGAGLLLAGIAGGAQFVARLGLPLACLGLARWQGGPPLRVAALAFWLVPLPNSLLELTSPGLESALAAFVASLWSALGVGVEAVGVSLVAGPARLDLRADNAGLPLLHCLAALGWYRGLRGAGGAAARGAALGCALAPPLQLLALALAAALVAAGERDAARLWLSYGSWALPAATWLLLGARRPGGTSATVPLPMEKA